MGLGDMVKLGAPFAPGDIDTTDQIAMFQGYGKAFIVNGDTSTNAWILDFTNVKTTTADISPGSNVAPMHATLCQSGTKRFLVDYVTGNSGAQTIYGKVISGTVNGNETFTGVNSQGDPLSVSFTLNSAPTTGPHWYRWQPYPTIGGIAFGSMPERAYLGVLYHGRCVLSGNTQYAHQWYMCRQANPWDWLYVSPDALTAVAGQNADSGEIGDVVRCLAAFRDDYLVFGCSSSIWVLRGDPAAGGSLDQISFSTGIWGQQSSCWDNFGNFYFFGNNGINRIRANAFSVESLTEKVIPDMVQNLALSHDEHYITLGYDRQRQGILTNITKLSDGTNTNYWFDLKTEGLFPESYPASCGVYSSYYYDSNEPTHRGLLLGGKNGYIRVEDDDTYSDAEDEVISTAIDSHALIGPAGIAQDPSSWGRVKQLSITSGSSTDEVDYGVYVADTAEEVAEDSIAEATALNTGTIIGGNRQQTLRPRSRGTWLGVRLGNDEEESGFEFEKLVADIKPAGDIK
ncbi:MAG: hypothetical protein ACYSTZ_00155 [Planctomycetota bacterium]|jgi:hypothetical protein